MQPQDLNPIHAAIVDGVCLMMAADGVVEDAELEFLYGMIGSLLGVDLDACAVLVADSLERIGGSNLAAFLDAIIERLRDNDEAQNYLMVALQLAAMADGHGSENEVALLDTLAERFGMSDDDVAAVSVQAEELYQALEADGGGP